MNNKRHKRSCSFSQYSDFQIESHSHLKSKEAIEEISTKGTPFRETPIQYPGQSDITNLIQLLSSNIKEEAEWKDRQKKEIREMVLDLFKQEKNATEISIKKKRLKNNSVGKTYKLMPKASTARAQKTFTKIKIKKIKAFAKKERESPIKIGRIGKRRIKSMRSGSTEIS